MKRWMLGLLIGLMFVSSGCVQSLQSAGMITQQQATASLAAPVSARTPTSSTLVYEHLTPVGATIMKNAPMVASKEAMTSADKKDAIIGVFNSESANTLMDNTPAIGYSMAAVVGAFTGSTMAIVPGLVGLPLDAARKVSQSNYKMQTDVINSNNALIAAAAASANTVEVERVYLPTHSSSVSVKREGLSIDVRGDGKQDVEVKEIK